MFDSSSSPATAAHSHIRNHGTRLALRFPGQRGIVSVDYQVSRLGAAIAGGHPRNLHSSGEFASQYHSLTEILSSEPHWQLPRSGSLSNIGPQSGTLILAIKCSFRQVIGSSCSFRHSKHM